MTVGGSTREIELAGIEPLANRAPGIDREEFDARLQKAMRLAEAMGAGALIVNAGASLRYFTGLPWQPTERLVALVLRPDNVAVMICPAFECGSLLADLSVDVELRLWEEDDDPVAIAAQLLGSGVVVATDPSLPFAVAERLRAAGIVLFDGEQAIHGCRAIKSPVELALMAEAKAMTLEVHRRAARILRPGIRASEVKSFIDAAHRNIGGAGSSFCAVQFGRATAYPHGIPGDQELADGDLVLIDTGTTVHGYHSDITRTYAFGTVDEHVREMWSLEKAAQAAAFAAVKPGVPCQAIDAAARRVLEDAGLGPGYRLPGLPHRTGHGIGMSIHEPPYLVRGDDTILAPGMCFSNEPMIVIPDRFGIRLEDHFHVTDTGAQWFTEPQYSLDRPFD
jgi:Xaa-Pro dipeptidase